MGKGVTMHSHEGKNYLPLVDYESWRVALLRDDVSLTPQTIAFFERHNESDEVFVLLEGACFLLWTEEDELSCEGMRAELMKPGVVYNVARGTWHSSALTDGSLVLIVENADTDDENSDETVLTAAQRARMVALAQGCGYPMEKERKT